MNVEMEALRDEIYISLSMSHKKEDYYKDGSGRGFWWGSGNNFYHFEIFLKDYSPDYDVNCLYN